ncbi:sulfite reductase [NADPH] flavoprotein alpha-component [Diplogelasinospora grovesii]|uniref:NADPH--hemoprotein reductase n=1 Tax=Diplogelasinospora grovesii TaxID=303347 RepID=A0AAN6N476_9PEZI|nr:sulfite reductase [NADPH] flavoprotein alpha-component [Diplogelasinospora grovesii]
MKNINTLNAREQDLLAVALSAPARQVMIRAEEIGPTTGWKDGYLSVEHGFCPPDYNESPGALANSLRRTWSDLCERMPGCVARGKVRESVAALPVALWAAVVALGMLCSIYRYEDKNDGHEGVTASNAAKYRPNCEMGDDLGEELVGIPRSIALPYFQVSRRLKRSIPHLTFFDQSSFNMKIKDPASTRPYVGRFNNMEMRWPVCQEHVMYRNVEGLLREMVRLKEILERMPNAFHSINTNPNSGENYVPGHYKRCPASSGLQFPPFLVMDAFLGRKKYDSFLGAEGLHLRAWLPSNWRAFIAAIEHHYRIPEFVRESGDLRLMGVLDGIVEAYTGERGFMGTHRYKVFGILEIASKTGRTETNGLSGATDDNGRPWEETHKQFSEAMKERLEPYRGSITVEPHEMRGTFEECRYRSRVISRSFVDTDPRRSIAMVTLDIQNTGITFQPGDRLAVMPLNRPNALRKPISQLTVKDVLRRGHLAPITKDLALKVHGLLRASSNTVLQVLATDEWPVRGSHPLQRAVTDTNPHIWDRAFNLTGAGANLAWLADLVPVEVLRTYSISSYYSEELLPSTVDLTISRAEYKLSSTFAGDTDVTCAGVGSGFLNPFVSSTDESVKAEDGILMGVSRPLNFQLPIDRAAPCAYFAGGSGIAPFRSFWQARLATHTNANSAGRDMLYLGAQSREKFCYEEELREYIDAGLLEVHLAFSRDTRGLVYDRRVHDLVEKEMPPRYIDALIVDQGKTISELVMSKKQGGLGGYLYVCGSVAVFDSVMSGIRKAIYHHCSATMDASELIINKAFAERRFMLDVFMTPAPLPYNLPTVPLSQLACQTGHRPGSRMWIGVHGSAYDVTDFCPMHPGGTSIVRSNAGVDCSQSFDNLAHTNNPEVSSLLTKYFVGQLTPKPDFHSCPELSELYDVWAAYLRTTVETLVAHQFEMYEIMGASEVDNSTDQYVRGSNANIWNRESLVNVGLGVRVFYDYQSRLLQGGFSALFGPKLQELVLKLSFTVADAAATGTDMRLPDILGIIARAKTSPDALATSQEVALVGQFVCDGSGNVRFAERGIFHYAAKCVELDIELLEDMREEACHGMDAFDTIMTMDVANDNQRLTVLASFLIQTLERMARRLEMFYARLAQYKVYQPELERNPARSRWDLVRRKIHGGSFFVLTQEVALGTTPGYQNQQMKKGVTDFDGVMSRIQASIRPVPKLGQPPQTLNAMHMARATATVQPGQDMTAMAAHDSSVAMRAMSDFIDKNKRAIRRLSKLPLTMPPTFEQLQAVVEQQQRQQEQAGMFAAAPPTPPSSRGSSRSPPFNKGTDLPGGMANMTRGMRGPPTPPPPVLDASTAINSMMSKLNVRSRGNSVPPSPAMSAASSDRLLGVRQRTMSIRSMPQTAPAQGHMAKQSTHSLRAFMLGSARGVENGGVKIAPTF